MAEIVGSAVANEAVSRVVSSFLPGDKTSEQQESVEDKAERLEMAVLKIRSVVAVSEHVHISHIPPLLQWRTKLKRVAEEGDDLLLQMHNKKQQPLRCNRVSDDSPTGGNSSISQYLIQAAKRFVPFCHKEDEELMSDNTLRRFERLADGADSFFRLVESGGHPSKSLSSPPLSRALLAGDSIEFLIRTKTGSDHIMVWPWLDPDARSGSGLKACLTVTREDEAVWQKGFKMSVLFRLSEASNILATAMSCLELLPPQFDAARVAITRLLTETITGQSSDRSSLSERSKWMCRLIQSYHRNDCESSVGDDKHRANSGMLLLSQPVLRFTAWCYASPCIDRKDGLPLELECHGSPYLLPEKHSSQYELVEQDVITKLLPNVTDGFYDYDDDRQPSSYQRQMWSPQSSMYCAVTPAYTQPLTVSQAYQMECSGSTRRRRRTAKTKSPSISKFPKVVVAVPH